MKKKIIFMIINMNVGGTEKALLNMISEMPEDKYDITILMLEKYGGFLSQIPREVKVEYVKEFNEIKEVYYNPPHITALSLLRKRKFFRAFNIMSLHFISKAMNNRSYFFKYLLKECPVKIIEYDVAVAYAGPMDLISYYVLNKIKAKKKVQWIHFDVSKIRFNHLVESKLYNQFDKILVVSNEGRKKLINLIPSLKEKTEVFLNIVSQKLIHSQVKEGTGFQDDFNGIRILTVGRLTSEKGQDIAIRVLAKLIENGYNVKWYCIGEGNSRTKYEKLIKEYNLEAEFILLGTDPNPYPYINQCDIYVQPSRHEGYCITLAEARCLNKPIITTDFTGANEQIKQKKTGLIVSVDEKEIYQALTEMINNTELRNMFSTNLGKELIDFTSKSRRISKLI
ncbi:MAG TPA: glycosyltransferase [Metabacillus sp.]|nr:glycosyltransferase [Metabacillus sp.]